MQNLLSSIVLVWVLLAGTVNTQAQSRGILVNFAVTPPYSSKLSDYASLPGKTIISLTNPASATGAPARVYLRITITGDNGIRITTKAGYRPSTPILVPPNVPTLLDYNALNTLFDVNTFDMVGITARQIATREGLPEGNYQICVRAWDYDSPTVPASADAPSGCVFIRLTQLEPPILVKPFDKENINTGASAVQNIIFSWNIPAGSEPGTQYLLRVIEILDPTKNPNDAMNSKTTPAFFENITNSNIFLYGPAQPALVAGRRYAWAVTAAPLVKESGYRNGGRSEVRSFIYGGTTTIVGNLTLDFIFPNKNNKVIPVNNQTDLVLNWNWLNLLLANQTLTDTTYKRYGVSQYELEIKPAGGSLTSDNTFSYKTTLQKKGDTLSHLFKRTESEALAMGFKDGYWYKASITAKDANGKTIQTATSVPFQFSNVKDTEPVYTTTVRAQLKYAFETKPGQYNASNTPVEIQAMRKTNNIPIPGQTKELINGNYYIVVASATQETSPTGDLQVDVKIPQAKLPGDTVYYRVKMNGAYYLYNHFPLLAARAAQKDTTISFGQQVAKTYGYTLKLNVSKAYPNYFVKGKDNGGLQVTVDTNQFSKDFTYSAEKGGTTYKSNQSKPEAGITIVIYRKEKKSYIPPVEGTPTGQIRRANYLEIGREKTTIEKDEKGNDRAVVNFNNLLANLFEGDEYYVKALSPDGTIFREPDFIASEMVLKVPKPVNASKPDSLYRLVKRDYNIISKKPPTSLVKGKLLYKWESEGNKAQLRPMSNQKFRVVIDYLEDGNSVGYVQSSTNSPKKFGFSEKFFVPDGQDEYTAGQQLTDFDQTMAVGTTDAEGNYEIEVVNFNKKGDLGKGKIVEQGWSANKPDPKTDPIFNGLGGIFADPVVNPWDGTFNSKGSYNSMPGGNYGISQTNLYNYATQGALNANTSGGFSFNSQDGFFEAGLGTSVSIQAQVGAKMLSFVSPPIETEQSIAAHGPSAPDESGNGFRLDKSDDPSPVIKRVYRIIPDNQYLYPTTETFEVQAFQGATLPALNSYVKEIAVKISTKSKKGDKLEGMLVTVFRPIGSKTAQMPFGEGDGNYLQKELTNPQYKAGSGDAKFTGGAGSIKDGTDIFSKKFEILTPEQTTNADGTTTIKHILAGYPYYFVASSKPTDGEKFFKATFVQSVGEEAVTMVLDSLPSRVLVQTIDQSTQQAAKFASVYVNKKYATWTDSYGYAELKGESLPGLVAGKGVTLTFTATLNGYHDSQPASFTFNAMGSQFVKALFLEPAGKITGKLVSKDENNKPVKGYVKSGTGLTVETNNAGYFEIPVPSLPNVKLEFKPKDVAYFDSTIFVSGVKSNVSKGDIALYRRKHRINIKVVQAGTNTTVGNAIVQLGDTLKTVNLLGNAPFAFENVSVNNYTFIVRGPKNSNYIPVTKNVKNEESKNYTTVVVELEKGSEVSGTVTLDNKPVKNAKVYLEASNKGSAKDKDENLLVTYTDAQGKYVLRGVPADNAKINIISTLDTSFTVNGDKKVADIQNKTAIANLALTSFSNMSITNVFGFPISVEKITNTANPDEVKVTGVIRWGNAVSDFKWIQGNDILRVEDVLFKASTVNGKKVGVVKDNSVSIEDAASFKLRYLDKYNVRLSRYQGITYPGSTIKPLSITSEDGFGVIKGTLNIIDNSFNYPSTYINFTKKDQFYLAKVDQGVVNTSVSAVRSAIEVSTANNGLYGTLSELQKKIDDIILGNKAVSPKLYNISNASGGNIDFKFIEFDANADAAKSYISKDGKIHLNVRMFCKLSNAQPDTFSVNVSDVVLDDNKVYPASSSSPIEVTLEKWKLVIKNWSLSTQEGGITSSNGYIHTSKLDIPFSKFVLRNDMFLIDEYQLDNLKLGGGIYTLKDINASNAALVWDNKTGNDMKGHWRFSMSSTGEPVAKLTGLPDLGGDVGIDYIQMLSNESNIFQLKQAVTPLLLYKNSIAKFLPQSISNGPDYFSITGALNIGAPRAGDMQLNLLYTKQGAGLAMKTGSVQADIEGKGFVHFLSADLPNNEKNISITESQIRIAGTVVEQPGKSFNPMNAELIAKPKGGGEGDYAINVIPQQVVQLNSGDNKGSSKGYKLTVASGGMKVVNKDWDVLTYSGVMATNNTSVASGVKPMDVTFMVLGDVMVDGSGAKMDNINTPFGAMKMVYEYPSRLVGTLKIEKVKLGTNTVTGTVETVFDKEGFYVAGGGTAQVVTGNPFVDGTYNLGLMIGSYPLSSPGSQLWKTVTAYKQPEVRNDCFIGKLNNRLKGFYLTADRIVVNESADFDFVLVSGYVQAKAIVGADLFANFNGDTNMGVAAYVYAHGSAGMSAITGTSMSGEMTNQAAAVMEKAGDKFNLDLNIDISFTAKIKQSLGPLGTLSESKDVGATVKVGTGGFSFHLTGGEKKTFVCY